jgi:hypothetical protein
MTNIFPSAQGMLLFTVAPRDKKTPKVAQSEPMRMPNMKDGVDAKIIAFSLLICVHTPNIKLKRKLVPPTTDINIMAEVEREKDAISGGTILEPSGHIISLKTVRTPPGWELSNDREVLEVLTSATITILPP